MIGLPTKAVSADKNDFNEKYKRFYSVFA